MGYTWLTKHWLKCFGHNFSGSKVKCKNNPGHIILWTGSNEKQYSHWLTIFYQKICQLVCQALSRVIVNATIRLFSKINLNLKKSCSEKKISFLDHSNAIDPQKSLSNSKLYVSYHKWLCYKQIFLEHFDDGISLHMTFTIYVRS